MGDRGIIQDRAAPETLRECFVEIPTLRDCRALATSLRSLADQLDRQPRDRRHGKIKLDPPTRRIVVALEEIVAIET